MKALRISQELVNEDTPTGLNWNEQVAGSATTVTGADAWALSSAGLAKWVMALKTGKYARAAIRQPAMMMGLRPMRSDKAPNTTKKGVPNSRARAIMMLAAFASIAKVLVRKKSA